MNCPVNKVAAAPAAFTDNGGSNVNGYILCVDEVSPDPNVKGVIVLDTDGYVVNATTSQGEVTSWNTRLLDGDDYPFHRSDYPTSWQTDYDVQGFVTTDNSLLNVGVI